MSNIIDIIIRKTNIMHNVWGAYSIFYRNTPNKNLEVCPKILKIYQQNGAIRDQWGHLWQYGGNLRHVPRIQHCKTWTCKCSCINTI